MSFRFRRSVRILPGVRLNFSRSGVSTTVGTRGLSVNVGRRGTYLNAGLPGTGIGSRTRLDGGRGATGSAAGGAAAAGGCLGCGGFAVIAVLFIGFCSAIVSAPSHAPAPGLDTGASYASTASSPDAPVALYALRPIHVRSGAGTMFPVVRTLARGKRVSVGAADASGWAPVYGRAGTREGFVFRASGALGFAPPHHRRSHRHSHASDQP